MKLYIYCLPVYLSLGTIIMFCLPTLYALQDPCSTQNRHSNSITRNALSWVDFDVSFGQGRPYFHQFYQNLVRKILSYQTTNSALHPSTVHNLFTLSKTLYRANHPAKIVTSAQPKIPLIIHQIWLGSPFPEKYKKWQQTWKNMGPGWQYKLWTDAEVRKLKLFNQHLYDRETNYGAKSDILRIELLYRYGGIYVDTDFECLNPEAFKRLHYLYDFYAGFHPADFKVFCLVNGLIGARPGHPILKGYIDELSSHYYTSNNILLKTGPGFFTLMFLKYAGKNFKDKDIAFGPSYFYPASLFQIQQLKHQPQQTIKSRVLFPESIALHWWEGSWWG